VRLVSLVKFEGRRAGLHHVSFKGQVSVVSTGSNSSDVDPLCVHPLGSMRSFSSPKQNPSLIPSATLPPDSTLYPRLRNSPPQIYPPPFRLPNQGLACQSRNPHFLRLPFLLPCAPQPLPLPLRQYQSRFYPLKRKNPYRRRRWRGKRTWRWKLTRPWTSMASTTSTASLLSQLLLLLTAFLLLLTLLLLLQKTR
jgi:hypothetical protein